MCSPSLCLPCVPSTDVYTQKTRPFQPGPDLFSWYQGRGSSSVVQGATIEWGDMSAPPRPGAIATQIAEWTTIYGFLNALMCSCHFTSCRCTKTSVYTVYKTIATVTRITIHSKVHSMEMASFLCVLRKLKKIAPPRPRPRIFLNWGRLLHKIVRRSPRPGVTRIS